MPGDAVQHTFNPSSTYKQTSRVVSNHRQRPTKASGARIRHRSRSVALDFSPSAFLRSFYLLARWIGLASLLETRSNAAACSCSLRLSVVGLLRADRGGLIGRPGEQRQRQCGAGDRKRGAMDSRCIGSDSACWRLGGNCTCWQ